jgi:hypothetical protein
MPVLTFAHHSATIGAVSDVAVYSAGESGLSELGCPAPRLFLAAIYNAGLRNGLEPSWRDLFWRLAANVGRAAV